MYAVAQSVITPLVLIPGPHGREWPEARPTTHRFLLEEREREANSREEMEIKFGGDEMNEERDREREHVVLFIIFRAVVIFHLYFSFRIGLV